MESLQHLIDSIHGLDMADKLVVRAVLDQDLATSTGAQAPSGSSLIGLLADEPQLADAISESAMAARETRPYRMSRE